MTDDGNSMLESLSATRNIFTQLSKLVLAFDGYVASEGWEPIPSNRAVDLNGSVSRPQFWMPATVYRMYGIPDRDESVAEQNISPFVGILLDRKNSWKGFVEPWVTFGIYQLARGRWPRNSDARWVETPLDERYDPDGIFHRWEAENEDPNENEGVLYQNIAARPLVEIASEEKLLELVVDPLLQAIVERKNEIKHPG